MSEETVWAVAFVCALGAVIVSARGCAMAETREAERTKRIAIEHGYCQDRDRVSIGKDQR